MSRIGKKPIVMPAGVEAKWDGRTLAVKGPKGELARELGDNFEIEIKDGLLLISLKKDGRDARMLWGTAAAVAKNMLEGAAQGFQKKLEIQGIGFKAALAGKDLALSLGFSHPVNFKAPEGITFTLDKNIITVWGIDKEKVGETARRLRSFKKPEPYKGKGIRYEGEQVRRKAGKKAAGTAT